MYFPTWSATTSAAAWRCGKAQRRVRKFRLDAADRKLRGLDEPWPGDHADRLARSGLPPTLMGEALGSIGGGNHFAELLRVDTVLDEGAFGSLGLDRDCVYLMVHSGSRGLGDAILQRQLARQNVRSLEAGSGDCTAYLEEHDQAIAWAILNRAIIAERFFERLGMKGRPRLDICHNSVTAVARRLAAPQGRGAGGQGAHRHSGIAWRPDLPGPAKAGTGGSRPVLAGAWRRPEMEPQRSEGQAQPALHDRRT